MKTRTATVVLLAFFGVSGPGTTLPARAQEADRVTQILRHNNLGIAWMDQLKFEQAAGEFEQVIQADPRFAPGWVNRGIARFYLQDSENAEKDFRKALELDAGQVQAHYMLGLIHRLRNQGEEALQAFEKVYSQDSEDPSTNYFLGTLYRDRREYDKAVPYLQKCIQLEPYNRSAYYGLSQALLRSGQREDGMRMMAEFRRLDGLSGTETIGQTYREQGRYSVAIDRIPEKYLPGTKSDPAAERIKVTFAETAAEAGLSFRHGGPGRIERQFSAKAEFESKIVPAMGSGVALGDYDGDGDLDVYLANASAQGARGTLFQNDGKGRFADVTARSGLDFSGKTMTALWGDADNDGNLDLYLVNYGKNRLYRNQGDGTFRDITEQAGVGDASWGLSGTFVDSDHDGDLDILVANLADPAKLPASGAFPQVLQGAANVHYRNNGDGTFSDVSQQSGLGAGPHLTTGVMATDFDNSRDIDLYLRNFGAAGQLFSNQRDGTFRDAAAETGAQASAAKGSALALGDLDRDARMDWAVAGESGRSSRILHWTEGRRYRESPLGGAADGAYASQLFDFDNDGDLDLLLLSAPYLGVSRSSGLQLLEYSEGRFTDATRKTGLDRYKDLPLRGAGIGDLDGDGDLDIVINVNGGAPLLLRNDGGSQNNWIVIDTRGTNSNKQGLGTKVEIRSGDFHLKREVRGGDGLLSQSSHWAHFGLGKRSRIDFLRLLWPGGVLQSELNPPVNRKFSVEELDRKGTSCPILYVWDGQGYRFVTDFLGGSAFGYLLSPGVYNVPDTDEYIKLDRGTLRLKDGRLAVTLNNQLEEVIFFDKLQLAAVDHPADYEVFPDEKLLPGPPYGEFRLFSVSNARSPLSARDGEGRDILPQLLHIDRQYPDLFRKLPFKGYAEPHQMILDLGSVSNQRAILIMQAWIDYADSTSNLAAWQAGISLQPPRLQVKDRDGNWVTVIERMGFPAGLPKPMTVDLSGKFLSDSREVRILTNMRIYWDQVLVESAPARRDYKLHRLAAARADLHFHGFPEFSSPDGKQPKEYFYERLSPQADWKVHSGNYTRYGDVLPLLAEADDMYVITRSGDEIEAFFDLAPLPELSHGWVRDYLIYVDGFGKDMDVNSADPDFVKPLPFHGMGSSPEGGYPDTEQHRRYRKQWNTRRLGFEGNMP